MDIKLAEKNQTQVGLYRKLWLSIEMVLLFVGIPLLYYFEYIPFHKSLPLLAIFLVCLVYLIKNPDFERKNFAFNNFKGWNTLISRFIAFALVTTVLVLIFIPDEFMFMPTYLPLIWIVILTGYPVWSAFPQELIYRAFFFQRYGVLFKNKWVMILVNATLFSFSHIIFNNWLAIALTFFGGILFAFTYLRSKSLLVVFFEHMIYGNFIFTIGIGQYFYQPMA